MLYGCNIIKFTAMISIILPSYLENYAGSAKNRIAKFERAVMSVVNQTYKDFELIIIADGCQKTVEAGRNIIESLPDGFQGSIVLFEIPKQKIWSGHVRNTGLLNCTGDIICYLDSDDYFQPNHLQFIADNLTPELDWVFFGDNTYKAGTWHERRCAIRYGHCGVSNIAHRKALKCSWPVRSKYAMDDWFFISSLTGYRHKYIGIGGYNVCHIPSQYDV